MDNIFQKIEAVASQMGVPSGAISIISKGNTQSHFFGKTNIETGNLPTKDTIYPIGSCSKSFIATACCILYDEGKLDFDAKLKTYLPYVKFYDDFITEDITVRDVLSMSSGVSSHNFLWSAKADTLTCKEYVEKLEYMQPSAPFRYSFRYQNHMYALACVLVEETAGCTWDKFVCDRILKPLNMNDTYCKIGDALASEKSIAKGYLSAPSGTKPIDYRDVYKSVGAAGSICSTLNDMEKYLKLHLNKGEYNGVRIFSEKVAEIMYSRQMIVRKGEFLPLDLPDLIKAEAYGFGWFVDDFREYKLLIHGGSIDGFRCIICMLPEVEGAFVLLTNESATEFTTCMTFDILDSILGIESDTIGRIFNMMGPMVEMQMKAEAELWGSINQEEVPTIDFDKLCGEYYNPIYDSMIISRCESGICAKLGLIDIELILKKGLEFIAKPNLPYLMGAHFLITFTLENGEIKNLIFFDGEVNIVFEVAK